VAPSSRAFYDRLAADYHLIYEDWPAAVLRQAALLDRLIRAELGTAASDLLDCACGIGPRRSASPPALGYRVSASDLSPGAVARATREAQARSLGIAFHVADIRALAPAVPGRFDVVLAADNALPHLLTDEDLAAALQGIAQKLSPDGLFLASVRDYDEALVEPAGDRARARPGRGRPAPHRAAGLGVAGRAPLPGAHLHHPAAHARLALRSPRRPLSRADPRRADRCHRGCRAGEVGWLMPEQSGFHQPLVLARRAEDMTTARPR
jgi:glycine/sarcosine N-methyltransferase